MLYVHRDCSGIPRRPRTNLRISVRTGGAPSCTLQSGEGETPQPLRSGEEVDEVDPQGLARPGEASPPPAARNLTVPSGLAVKDPQATETQLLSPAGAPEKLPRVTQKAAPHLCTFQLPRSLLRKDL